MKVQEGYHRFMVKIVTPDHTHENRHVKRWVSKDTAQQTVCSDIAKEFRCMYNHCIIEVVYRGEVEYKYDDWEIGI